MEIPSFEKHKQHMQRPHGIVEVSSSAFNRVAAEHSISDAVGTFGVIDEQEPHERTVYVDKDLYKMPRPTNPEENFEDIKSFTIEYEIIALYSLLKGLFQEKDNPAEISTEPLVTLLFSLIEDVHKAGLLGKLSEFRAVTSMIRQQNSDEEKTNNIDSTSSE